MPAGAVRPSFGPINAGPRTEETFIPQRAYPAAIEQTGRDYDELMGRFRSALERPSDTSGLMQRYEQMFGQTPEAYTPYVPERQSFTGISGIGDLEELSRTGGLDEAAQANLRARGVSPIRATYANAMRQMERSRALQGGYSPNMPAAQARMSRELSESLAGQTSNVNAQIAQIIQQGRLQAAPQLAGIREREAGRETEIERANIGAQERAEQFNRQMMAQMRGQETARQATALQGMTGLKQAETGRESELLGGMRSLYGTTPALAATFGQQALQTESMARQPIPTTRTQVGRSKSGRSAAELGMERHLRLTSPRGY